MNHSFNECAIDCSKRGDSICQENFTPPTHLAFSFPISIKTRCISAGVLAATILARISGLSPERNMLASINILSKCGSGVSLYFLRRAVVTSVSPDFRSVNMRVVTV
jgi:hypothetical protein